MQIRAVVAYSEADRDSLAVRLADEAVCIGPAQVSRLLHQYSGDHFSAALVTGCDALHPGYGFLSENAYLAEICAEVGVTFIGPPASVIAQNGEQGRSTQGDEGSGRAAHAGQRRCCQIWPRQKPQRAKSAIR